MTTAVAVLIALYVLCQLRFGLSITVDWWLRRRPLPAPRALVSWPRVTVQLAVYREHHVLRGLIESMIAMDAPRHALAVQVLDDSTGDDAERARAIVEQFKDCGVPVSYVNRGSRKGYKAGALNHGLALVDTELVAFFDADCKPAPGFLAGTVPFLIDPEVAAVQARFDYPNALSSPLAQLQAAIFEWLFRFEITLQAKLGLPAYYMGTGAVWRSDAIRALGGWREEPFTAEDLDLSYRAGIRGWKVMYQPERLASTTAVEELLAFRMQQRRWARSMLRAGWDNFPDMIRTPWSWGARLFEWSILMTHSAGPVLLAAVLASSVAVFTGVARSEAWIAAQLVLTASLVASPLMATMALTQRSYHPDWRRRVWLLACALPESVGLTTSFVFGLADILGLNPGEFITTPKGGQVGVVQGNRYRWLTMHLGPVVLELIAGGIALVAAAIAVTSYPEAALPLAMVGGALAISCVRTTRAIARHAARLRGSR
jgi:cellulose synthase/poly-beta-1,6-N-acetylglucosamine synthase-like glycosyltransferase